MDEEIRVVTSAIQLGELIELSERGFGDMIKAVVDVERGIMAIGGELHSDEEQVLLDQGSRQHDLWGINIYHGLPHDEWVEFDSMINIRPSQGNRSRGVEDEAIQGRIQAIVERLIR